MQLDLIFKVYCYKYEYRYRILAGMKQNENGILAVALSVWYLVLILRTSVRESEEFYNRLSNQIRGNISIVSRL
jgi:hypothetical protein